MGTNTELSLRREKEKATLNDYGLFICLESLNPFMFFFFQKYQKTEHLPGILAFMGQRQKIIV